MAKKNIVKRTWVDGVINAVWPDGVSTSYPLLSIPTSVQVDLTLHGLEQKLFDSIAGDGNAGVSYNEMRDTIGTVFENLVSGNWKSASKGGVAIARLAEACSRVHGKPVEKFLAYVTSVSPEQRAALAKDLKIAAALKQIESEEAAARAAAAVESVPDAELAGMLNAIEAL